jgi:hypothetical protein
VFDLEEVPEEPARTTFSFSVFDGGKLLLSGQRRISTPDTEFEDFLRRKLAALHSDLDGTVFDLRARDVSSFKVGSRFFFSGPSLRIELERKKRTEAPDILIGSSPTSVGEGFFHLGHEALHGLFWELCDQLRRRDYNITLKAA